MRFLNHHWFHHNRCFINRHPRFCRSRRGSRYRRTQYLAGLRCLEGLIIFGPILILAGMGLLMMAKDI